MAARIIAWKTTAEVAAGDLGKFKIEVKRLGEADRAEVVDFAERLRAGVKEEDVSEVVQIVRAQVGMMVIRVLGLEFEWAEGERETVETAGELMAAFDRLDPRMVFQRLIEVWSACFKEQYLPPFCGRLSATTPDSLFGGGPNQKGTPGAKPPTAKRAKRRTSAKSGGA